MKAQPDTLAGSPVARYYRANDPNHWLEARDSPDVSAVQEAANQQQARAMVRTTTPLAETLIKAILRACG